MDVTGSMEEPTFSFQSQCACAATISSGELLFDEHARSKSQMGHHYPWSQSKTRYSPLSRASRISSNYYYNL